jgi:hypothetical protein
LQTNIFYHMIRLILCLQQTGEIDNLTASWGKVLWLCCVQVARCCWRQSYAQIGAINKLSRAVAKLASPSQLASTFRSGFFLLLVRLNLSFILRETCRCAHHTFLLGFPTGWLAQLPIKHFSGAIAGDWRRRSSHVNQAPAHTATSLTEVHSLGEATQREGSREAMATTALPYEHQGRSGHHVGTLD